MFEGTKAKLRDWGDRVDERLMGITPQTNEMSSRQELGYLLGRPAAQAVVEFGLELAEISHAE